jgi:hypothetical protein
MSSSIVTPLAVSLSLLSTELFVLYAHLVDGELQLAHYSGRVKREGCRRIVRLSIQSEKLEDFSSHQQLIDISPRSCERLCLVIVELFRWCQQSWLSLRDC